MSKEYFNQMAENWDVMIDHNENIIEEVVEDLPDFSQPSILDIGAGTGVMVPFLQDRYEDRALITELDFAEKMIEFSRKKHGLADNIEYIVGDIYDYPLPEKNYDLIICYSVFPHFSDKKGLLNRCQELLNDEGRLLIFHSQSRQVINNLHKEAGKEVRSDNLPPAAEVVVEAVDIGYDLLRARDDRRNYLLEFKRGE